jgi:Domain of unknown function (DUF4277)
MSAPQAPSRPEQFTLRTERLGPLPLINHFIERMGLEGLLDKYVPTADRRCTLSHARALGVLLRSILVEREPILTPGRDGARVRSGAVRVGCRADAALER